MTQTFGRILRILLVGEKTGKNSELSAKLRDLGLDCAHAFTSVEALVFLTTVDDHGLRPSLIVCDTHLADCSGSEFVDQLRLRGDFADIPVIIATDPIENVTAVDNAYQVAKSSGLMQSISALIALNGAPETPIDERNEHASTVKNPSDPVDILIAEDNDINQLVLAQFLETTPWSFAIVGNGRRAVHAFRNTKPRLILMDISMPEMDGRAASAAIRALEQGSSSHIPIIALTAHALKGDREACLAAGMDDYMSKPVDFRALRMLIERFLEPSQAERNAA